MATSEVLAGLGEGLQDAGASSLASHVARVATTRGDGLAEEHARVLSLTDFAVRFAAPAALDVLQQPGHAAYLHALAPVVDTFSAITAREAVACLAQRGADVRCAALASSLVELTVSALWADGAVAAQQRRSHPIAALVDAEVVGCSFSSPLDLPYFEQFGYAAGTALAVAVATAPWLDGAIHALLETPADPLAPPPAYPLPRSPR